MFEIIERKADDYLIKYAPLNLNRVFDIKNFSWHLKISVLSSQLS